MHKHFKLPRFSSRSRRAEIYINIPIVMVNILYTALASILKLRFLQYNYTNSRKNAWRKFFSDLQYPTHPAFHPVPRQTTVLNQ